MVEPLSDAEINTLAEHFDALDSYGDRARFLATIHKLQADRNAIRGILAVIHRDGGHHTEKVGYRRSVEDAHQIWGDLQTAISDATAERDRLRGALEYIRDDLLPYGCEHDIPAVVKTALTGKEPHE